MRIRPLLPIIAASILVFTAPVLAHGGREPRTAPLFHLATPHGSVALDSLRGKVVLVDFWASWCVPCERSFPWMSTLRESLAPQGFEVVAINLDKELPAVDQFLARHPVGFVIAFDPDGKTAEAYQVAAMPTSFVIDRSGQVVLSHRGFDPKKTAELETAIRKECAR